MSDNDYTAYVADDERLYINEEEVPSGNKFATVTLTNNQLCECCQTPMGYAWYYKDGKPVLLEHETEDSKRMKLHNELNAYQAYLSDTDYVITKLNELKLEDEDEYETEKANYADVLAKRKEARKKINELTEQTEA